MNIEDLMGELVNSVYDIKNKITNDEYIKLMNICYNLHKKIHYEEIEKMEIEEEIYYESQKEEHADSKERYYNNNIMSASETEESETDEE